VAAMPEHNILIWVLQVTDTTLTILHCLY